MAAKHIWDVDYEIQFCTGVMMCTGEKSKLIATDRRVMSDVEKELVDIEGAQVTSITLLSAKYVGRVANDR